MAAAASLVALGIFLGRSSGQNQPAIHAAQALHATVVAKRAEFQASQVRRSKETFEPVYRILKEMQGASSAGMNHQRFLDLFGRAQMEMSVAGDRLTAMSGSDFKRLAGIQIAYLGALVDYEASAKVWQLKFDDQSDGLYTEHNVKPFVRFLYDQYGLKPHERYGEQWYFIDTLISTIWAEASKKADRGHALYLAASGISDTEHWDMDPLNDPPIVKPPRPRPQRPTPHPRRDPPPPLVSKGFLQGIGILIGVGIAALGFVVPWTTGVIFIGLGVIVIAVVAMATR
jgi:hypothetical protein